MEQGSTRFSFICTAPSSEELWVHNVKGARFHLPTNHTHPHKPHPLPRLPHSQVDILQPVGVSLRQRGGVRLPQETGVHLHTLVDLCADATLEEELEALEVWRLQLDHG